MVNIMIKIALVEKKGICRTSEQLTDTRNHFHLQKSATFADYSPQCSLRLTNYRKITQACKRYDATDIFSCLLKFEISQIFDYFCTLSETL